MIRFVVAGSPVVGEGKIRSAQSIVRVFITEMWGRGNTDLAYVLVDEHYRADGVEVGRDFVRRNMSRFRADFPDYTVRDIHLVANEGEGKVAILFELCGTHEGTFGSMEPTGRQIRLRESGFFTVASDRIIAAEYVSDSLGLRIQRAALTEEYWMNPHPERW